MPTLQGMLRNPHQTTEAGSQADKTRCKESIERPIEPLQLSLVQAVCKRGIPDSEPRVRGGQKAMPLVNKFKLDLLQMVFDVASPCAGVLRRSEISNVFSRGNYSTLRALMSLGLVRRLHVHTCLLLSADKSAGPVLITEMLKGSGASVCVELIKQVQRLA